jgi:hypothetical protein
MFSIHHHNACFEHREFHKEYELVASSWKSVAHDPTLFFSTLDFNDAREIFKKVVKISVVFGVKPHCCSSSTFKLFPL